MTIFCYLLEKVLGSRTQHELLVNLHVELGALGLEFAAAGCGARVRTLKQTKLCLTLG